MHLAFCLFSKDGTHPLWWLHLVYKTRCICVSAIFLRYKVDWSRVGLLDGRTILLAHVVSIWDSNNSPRLRRILYGRKQMRLLSPVSIDCLTQLVLSNSLSLNANTFLTYLSVFIVVFWFLIFLKFLSFDNTSICCHSNGVFPLMWDCTIFVYFSDAHKSISILYKVSVVLLTTKLESNGQRRCYRKSLCSCLGNFIRCGIF